MITRLFSFTQVAIFWLCICEVLVFAQVKDQLPEWEAPKEVVAQLGKQFSDPRISITPPRNLTKADPPNPPDMTKIGVYNYGWSPSGVFPSIENFTVTLAPYAQPSSAALDKTVQGMKNSIQQGLKNVQFGDVRQGRLNGIEARTGQYTANIAGEKVVALYLIGIDDAGTFNVAAMIPQSKATPERINELLASMLTFQRVK